MLIMLIFFFVFDSDKIEQMIPQMGSKSGISVVKMGVLVKGMSVLCLNKLNNLKSSNYNYNFIIIIRITIHFV